jgi:hypothetical protein
MGSSDATVKLIVLGDRFRVKGNPEGERPRGPQVPGLLPLATIREFDPSTHTALMKDEWCRRVHRDRGAERGVESTGARPGPDVVIYCESQIDSGTCVCGGKP